MTAELPRLLDALPAGLLPPGRLVTPEEGGKPAYWLSDEPAEPGLWARLRAQHPTTGLWPLLLGDLGSDPDRPWVVGEVDPANTSSADAHDPAALLAEWWDEATGGDQATAAPFGGQWPGLADPGFPVHAPDDLADEYADVLLDGQRLGLVPASRGADTLAVTGWMGPANFTGDSGQIAAVVRTWEERFAARVVSIGFDTLYLSVAAPPITTVDALGVAAEHFACCPDLIWQGSGTLAAYAEHLVNLNCWSFWWD